MDEIVFSVIIPAYCAENTIKECLSSALDRQRVSLEVIVVDDGSTDNTLDIVNALSSTDRRIKVLHKKNGGLSSARNAGMKIASGKYLVFLDSDDALVSGSLDEMEAAIKGIWPDIVVGDVLFEKKGKVSRVCSMDSQYKMRCLDSREFVCQQLTHGKFWTPVWFNIYRTEFIKKHHLEFVEGIFLEDDEWTIRTFNASSQVLYSGICLYRYVLRENSIMQQKDCSKHVKDGLAIYGDKRAFYSKYEDKEFARIMNGWIAERYLVLYTTWPREFWKLGLKLDDAWILKHADRKSVKMKAFLYHLFPRFFGYLYLLRHMLR